MQNLLKKYKNAKFVIGIDEVGRGPLAGPVTVCGVLIEVKNLKTLDEFFKNTKDSKKTSQKRRVEISELITENTQKEIKDKIFYSVKSKTNREIDKFGISVCIKKCVEEIIDELTKINFVKSKLKLSDFLILLDGNLKAPAELNQETIIKGDEKILNIKLASIIAKCDRDDYMHKIAKSKKYKNYEFQRHVGYGTKIHREAILEFGLSDLHRKSFCKNIFKLNG